MILTEKVFDVAEVGSNESSLLECSAFLVLGTSKDCLSTVLELFLLCQASAMCSRIHGNIKRS